MSNDLVLSGSESKGFIYALDYAKKWSAENQWAVGIGEMAVGAALVAWGVHSGLIEMGNQLVATELGGFNSESIAGAMGGTGLGAIAGSIIGSIGIAGMGGAIGIPAALVVGGAATVLGMAGYTVGDVISSATTPVIDYGALVPDGSILLVGVALIIDGARRLIKDQKTLATLSMFKDSVLHLTDLTSKVIAKSIDELRGFIEELKKLPEDRINATIGTSSAAFGAGVGASAGGAIAASSVTVLGSSALGSTAISLGLVSAPIWPVIASVAGGAGLGYAAYKAVKYWSKKPESEDTDNKRMQSDTAKPRH